MGVGALRRFYLERPYFTRACGSFRKWRSRAGGCSDPWAPFGVPCVLVDNTRQASEQLWEWMSATVRGLNEVFAVAWSMDRMRCEQCAEDGAFSVELRE